MQCKSQSAVSDFIPRRKPSSWWTRDTQEKRADWALKPCSTYSAFCCLWMSHTDTETGLDKGQRSEVRGFSCWACPQQGSPQWHPARPVQTGHCPDSWGRGSRGPTGLTSSQFCDGCRSRPQCRLLRWCLKSPQWRWAGASRPPSTAPAPNAHRQTQVTLRHRSTHTHLDTTLLYIRGTVTAISLVRGWSRVSLGSYWRILTNKRCQWSSLLLPALKSVCGNCVKAEAQPSPGAKELNLSLKCPLTKLQTM